MKEKSENDLSTKYEDSLQSQHFNSFLLFEVFKFLLGNLHRLFLPGDATSRADLFWAKFLN